MKNGLFLKKKNSGGGGGGSYENPPGIFHFFYFTPGNSRQNKAPALEIPQIFATYIPWKFQDQKPKPLAGNSTLFFLGHPWKFHCVFN